jgi:hypothetical protein
MAFCDMDFSTAIDGVLCNFIGVVAKARSKALVAAAGYSFIVTIL